MAIPRKLLWGVLLVVFISGGLEVAHRMEWLNAAENWYYDVWHQLGGSRYEPQHVVIAAIDDPTRLEHQDEPLVFWSPHFARAIAVLRQAGARVIGLDFLFSVSAESWLKKLKLPESDQSRTYDLPFREQLASGQVILAGDLVRDAQGQEKILLPLPDYWGSLPGQLDDLGLVKFFSDPDGVIRRFSPVMSTGGEEAWVTFANLLAERALPKGALPQAPPLSRIGYCGPPGTIPRISFGRLLRAEANLDP